MPTISNGAAFNYLLTDYPKEDGGLSFVPGSHSWWRMPSSEGLPTGRTMPRRWTCRAGSMIIFGDHTRHGSDPKFTDGRRLMILSMYNRPHMQIAGLDPDSNNEVDDGISLAEVCSSAPNLVLAACTPDPLRPSSTGLEPVWAGTCHPPPSYL